MAVDFSLTVPVSVLGTPLVVDSLVNAPDGVVASRIVVVFSVTLPFVVVTS